MPLKVGLDTSFVLGLVDDQDLWHPQASALQLAFDSDGMHSFIFDCVLAEVISTLARRTHEKRRAGEFLELSARLKSRFPTKAITWLYPDLPQTYDEVRALMEQSGGELNFNDALIAISCRNRRISFLASFDADFDRVDWLKLGPRICQLPEGVVLRHQPDTHLLLQRAGRIGKTEPRSQGVLAGQPLTARSTCWLQTTEFPL